MFLEANFVCFRLRVDRCIVECVRSAHTVWKQVGSDHLDLVVPMTAEMAGAP